MNYLERMIFSRMASTPAMLPAAGPRIQPPLPPGVRLRTPNATTAAGTASGERARSVGMPAAARRALRFRNPRGNGNKPAGAGGALNCPDNQVATWFESPPNSGNMILQCQPLKITLKPSSKPQGSGAGINMNCTTGQIPTTFESPPNSGNMITQCQPAPFTNTQTKDTEPLGGSRPGLPWRIRYGSRFADAPISRISRMIRFVPSQLPKG